MQFLSLDLSTKSSGVAVFEDTKLIYSCCITSSSTDLIKRIKVMQEGIKEILEKFPKIEKIIVEEVRPENGLANIQTHRALMWVQGAIAITIYDFNKKIKIEYVYPNSWRASLGIRTGRGIKRESLKVADIKYVKENFGLEVNDDEADAICIGYAYITKANNEINWE